MHKLNYFFMKRIYILLLTFCLVATAMAQEKKQVTLEQAVLGQWSQFRPKSLSGFAWRPKTEAFTYVENDCIVQQGCKATKVDTLVSLDQINDALKQASLPELRWLRYAWDDSKAIKIMSGDFIAIMDISSRVISHSIVFPKGQNHEASPDLRKVAYTVDNNLYVKDGNVATPITSDLNPEIVNGQTVHRNEFGIYKGTFWSPQSNLLAYYRMDETMVANYPLVDITQRVAAVQNCKYPMAGMKSHEVTLHVYDLKTKQTVTILTGEPKEQYLTNVAWSPDEKSIYIAVLNREQNHMKLNRYNAQTGEFEVTLFEETDEQYVEPQVPMVFLPTDESKFIWQSRRDGWNHLYLYNVNGKLEKQITKGEWEVEDYINFDSKSQRVFISTTKDSPIERHTYAVSIKNGEMSRLTAGEGTHSIRLSPDFAYYMDFYSSVTVPNVVNLYNGKCKLVRNVVTAQNPYVDYSVSLPELVTLKNANGDALYGRILKPANFDVSNKYPVVVYVYGGPHSQMVTNSWFAGASLWMSNMANRGFIVFTLDNRGTSARGADFEQAIHRNLSVCEMEDQMVGVDYLKSLPFVDAERIGVHGWSYGGFMTTSLMLKHAETFKVGVAGGPVTDWKFYEVMYGERYMDMPQENPEGYKNTDLKNFVKNLQGKFMIIHDDMDNTVVPQHSLTLIHEFVKNGVQMDFFMYPQHEHNVRGKDRVHLIEKIIRYFEANL